MTRQPPATAPPTSGMAPPRRAIANRATFGAYGGSRHTTRSSEQYANRVKDLIERKHSVGEASSTCRRAAISDRAYCESSQIRGIYSLDTHATIVCRDRASLRNRRGVEATILCRGRYRAEDRTLPLRRFSVDRNIPEGAEVEFGDGQAQSRIDNQRK